MSNVVLSPEQLAALQRIAPHGVRVKPMATVTTWPFDPVLVDVFTSEERNNHRATMLYADGREAGS